MKTPLVEPRNSGSTRQGDMCGLAAELRDDCSNKEIAKGSQNQSDQPLREDAVVQGLEEPATGLFDLLEQSDSALPCNSPWVFGPP